jgi:hypothetical protein
MPYCTGKCGQTGNTGSATKMLLNLLGNIFASPDANCMLNIDRKHNVSATMFPRLPKVSVQYHEISMK